MKDDNVFFQDYVRLYQRFIELQQEELRMSLYPVERHGFVQPIELARRIPADRRVVQHYIAAGVGNPDQVTRRC